MRINDRDQHQIIKLKWEREKRKFSIETKQKRSHISSNTSGRARLLAFMMAKTFFLGRFLNSFVAYSIMKFVSFNFRPARKKICMNQRWPFDQIKSHTKLFFVCDWCGNTSVLIDIQMYFLKLTRTQFNQFIFVLIIDNFASHCSAIQKNANSEYKQNNHVSPGSSCGDSRLSRPIYIYLHTYKRPTNWKLRYIWHFRCYLLRSICSLVISLENNSLSFSAFT